MDGDLDRWRKKNITQSFLIALFLSFLFLLLILLFIYFFFILYLQSAESAGSSIKKNSKNQNLFFFFFSVSNEIGKNDNNKNYVPKYWKTAKNEGVDEADVVYTQLRRMNLHLLDEL